MLVFTPVINGAPTVTRPSAWSTAGAAGVSLAMKK
jgi:hypothetical protein